MARFKIKLDFAKLGDAGLLVFCLGIISRLAASLYFLTPSPTLLQITALKDAFVEAVTNAAFGGTALKLIRDQKKVSLIEGLRLLASNFEDTAGNDPVKLGDTGFDIYGGLRSLWPIPGIAENLRLFYGKISGTVIVRVKRANFTLMYECRYTLGDFGDDAVWITIPKSTKSRMIITGIPLGRSIWVQVRCVNGKGEGDWSDPAQLKYIH